MIPFITHPLALIAALTIPALAAIYLLRNHFKRKQIAGLFLWLHSTQPRDGGLHIHRIRTPLLFIIELLTLIALIIAAIDPRIPHTSAQHTLIVILDNSASMLAKQSSPREHALQKLRKIIKSEHFKTVSFILAGTKPTLLDITSSTHWNNSELIKNWSCHEPQADLNTAIATANEFSSRQAQILVITDHAPKIPPANNTIRWIAFGKPQPNIGFINARISKTDTKNRLFVAIANFSEKTIKTTIPITSQKHIIKQLSITIPKNSTKSAFISLPLSTNTISMQLPKDNLDIDNSITLIPPQTRRISIKTSIKNQKLRDPILRAITASGLNKPRSRPDLLITDHPSTNLLPDTIFQISTPTNTIAYRGPFVIDHNHPLTQGLNFDGIIWSANPSNSIPGTPIILAGNTPLLSTSTRPNKKIRISMQIDIQKSNLSKTPTWPVLIWNICQLCANNMPGPLKQNHPTCTNAKITLPQHTRTIFITYPDNTTQTRSIHTPHTSIQLPIPGIYTIKQNPTTKPINIAAQFLAPHESNLSTTSSGEWGNWHDTQNLIRKYRSLAWIAALIALILLSIHTVIIATQSKRDQS